VRLGREAGEDAADRDAGTAGDDADGRILVADVLEKLARSVEDTLPRRLLARLT
jgi:hypothetical protein